MSNLMQIFEKEQIAKLTSKKNIPAFRPGDTLRITVKIVEGERSRFQAFEGICIARKNNSVNSKFTVRKISHGEGVERVFPLFSQVIDKIEVIKKGRVKRAKLYYLRNRTGKRARIADSNRGNETDQYSMTESEEIISNLSDLNRLYKISKEGISILHGPHHVAQKLISRYLPLKCRRLTSSPSRFFRVKSWAIGIFSLASTEERGTTTVNTIAKAREKHSNECLCMLERVNSSFTNIL